MAYDMYFDRVVLPIPPASMKTKISNKNKTVDLINDGEVNILKNPGLTEISFSLSLPNMRYGFAKYPDGFKKASYYLDILQEYKESKKPFQFILSRVLPDGTLLFYTNMKVSLENYDFEDNASDAFDIKVNVTLKQYKTYGTKTVKLSTSTTQKSVTREAGAGANTSGTKYKIKSGDTLWTIAKLKKGSGTLWTSIYNQNKGVIEEAAKKNGRASSSFGHWLFPGTTITII